jgi:drug/metabolite transporter (DMT)-like permease
MTFSVQLGLIFALATAFASIVGFLYKHRGAVESPPVDPRRPVRSSLALFRSRWYTLGIVVAMASWGFHVAALSLAPISLVQSVIAGGLVMLTVIADRLFGFRVTRREWIGVALTAAGLSFLAATLGDTADAAHNDYEPAVLIVYSGALCALGAAAAFGSRLRPAHGGALLAASAGLIWGASDTCIKALSGRVDDGFAAVMLHPLALFILVASLVGMAVSARSLQVGDAVPVIAVTSAAANVVTIGAGPAVFGEPMPSAPFELALRISAFVLVIAAAALTPPPVRAAGIEREPQPA